MSSQYISYSARAGNAFSSIVLNGSVSGTITVTAGTSVTSYSLILPNAQGAADSFLKNDGSGNLSWSTAAGGVTTMAAVGSSPNANGASISSVTLTLQPASSTLPGVVTAGTQSFGGAKTFTGTVTVASPATPTGTGVPDAYIKVKSDASIDGILVVGDAVQAKISNVAYGTSNLFKGYRAAGTAAAPTASTAASLTSFQGFGYDGTAFALGGYFTVQSNVTWGGSDHETYLIFGGTASGSTTAGTIGTWKATGITAVGLNLSGLTASTVPYVDSSKNFVSSAVTPTQLGYLASATGTTGTASTNLVFSASPTLTGTVTLPSGSVTSSAWVIGAGTTGGFVTVQGRGLDCQYNSSGVGAYVEMIHNQNTAGSSANFYASVAGANAGDATIGFNVLSITDWILGIDNSVSDSFVISNSSSLGSNNALSFAVTTLAATFGGVVNASTGGLRTKVSTADVSNPPTNAELVSAFGAAATVGAGFMAIVDDANGHANEYLVWSDGTKYWVVTGTAAA